jgi:hypothetical protein
LKVEGRTRIDRVRFFADRSGLMDGLTELCEFHFCAFPFINSNS